MQRQRALFPRKKLIFERTDAEDPQASRPPCPPAAVKAPFARERAVLLHKARKTAHRVLVDLFGDAEAHILLMRPRRGKEQAGKHAPLLPPQPLFQFAFGALGALGMRELGNEGLQHLHAALRKLQSALCRLFGQLDEAQQLHKRHPSNAPLRAFKSPSYCSFVMLRASRTVLRGACK